MSRARRRRSKNRARSTARPTEPRLDLHLHSTSSDGRHPPIEVLEIAAARGLHSIALTDHDVPPSLASGDHTFGDRTIRLIHAAEVSASHDGIEFHLLAYFHGDMPEGFRTFLKGRARARAHRYDTAAGPLGLPPSDPTARAGDRALTRFHLAQALVSDGQCGSIHSAFMGPLSRDKQVVPPIELTVADALSTMREFGAIPVWAHPMPQHATKYAAVFQKLGLLGLEARPAASHPQRAALARLALDLGLVVTGGSDWHGWSGRLGSFRVKASEIAPFLAMLDPPDGTGQDSVGPGVDHSSPKAVDHL